MVFGVHRIWYCRGFVTYSKGIYMVFGVYRIVIAETSLHIEKVLHGIWCLKTRYCSGFDTCIKSIVWCLVCIDEVL